MFAVHRPCAHRPWRAAGRGQFGGGAEFGARFLRSSELLQQVAAQRGQQIRVLAARLVLQRVGDGEALRWSKRHADRHRAVDFEQLTPRRIGAFAFAFAVVALGAICLGYQS
ncbi:hypothetical protein [Mesorhizobium sp.]|uniref:hypothetical protein n=1 Tax=Mesorhizobium sp. TaxID=1871066 RepID=UPI0025BE9526|nr:hypothetical protein [Mesorhizobium sp.]